MRNLLSSFFHSRETNIHRQQEVDIAKGFAIVFMVLCHVFEILTDWSSWTLELLLDCILGGPFSAGVFMFCMGIGISYSRRNDPKHLFLRGCKLLIIGFILELIRDIIPFLIKQTFRGVSPIYDGILSTIDVDILQFAGLFFIFFSFIIKIKLKTWMFIALSLLFSIIGQLLRNVSIENAYINLLLAGYIWRSHSSVWFPFLNWFIFPCIGYLFGNLWRHCYNKKKFYTIITPIAWLVTILYFFFTYPYKGIFDHNLYYGIGTVDAFFVIILILATLGSSYYVSLRFPKFSSLLCWMSKYVNEIYCVHWVIISYLALIIQLSDTFKIVQNSLVVPTAFLVLTLTCILVTLHNKIGTKL